jgi:hypothetical protein
MAAFFFAADYAIKIPPIIFRTFDRRPAASIKLGLLPAMTAMLFNGGSIQTTGMVFMPWSNPTAAL